MERAFSSARPQDQVDLRSKVLKLDSVLLASITLAFKNQQELYKEFILYSLVN